MSEASTYQQLRSHLAYLRLASAAEALPAELDYAREHKLGHSAFLASIHRWSPLTLSLVVYELHDDEKARSSDVMAWLVSGS